MSEERGALTVDTLVKIVLALLAILLLIYLIQAILGLFVWFIELAIPLLILGGILLVVLWWFDKI